VFERYAERYDQWFERPFGQTAFQLELECLRSLCKGLEGPFLEVGVGTGRFASSLGIKYGVDRARRVLEIAGRRGISVIRAMGESLPFPNGTFGAVFLIATLCFVDDPRKVLREAFRVLRSGGSVIMGLILRGSPWASFYQEKGRRGHIFYRIARFYAMGEVERMLTEAGFKISGVCSTIFQPPMEGPLHPETPRPGYHRRAGFIAIKAQRKGEAQAVT